MGLHFGTPYLISLVSEAQGTQHAQCSLAFARLLLTQHQIIIVVSPGTSFPHDEGRVVDGCSCYWAMGLSSDHCPSIFHFCLGSIESVLFFINNLMRSNENTTCKIQITRSTIQVLYRHS